MPEPYAVYAVDIRESAARLESLTKDKWILKNQKQCTSCGAWIPNEDRFCGKCGAENEILVRNAKSGEAEEAAEEAEPAEAEETKAGAAEMEAEAAAVKTDGTDKTE